MAKQTTGKVTKKRYRCLECKKQGRETIKEFETNHYGNIYNLQCPTGFHGRLFIDYSGEWECIEPLPDGWDKPEPWKTVKLGDVAEIVEGKG